MICFDSQGTFICSLSAGKELKQKEGFFWTSLLGHEILAVQTGSDSQVGMCMCLRSVSNIFNFGLPPTSKLSVCLCTIILFLTLNFLTFREKMAWDYVRKINTLGPRSRSNIDLKKTIIVSVNYFWHNICHLFQKSWRQTCPFLSLNKSGLHAAELARDAYIPFLLFFNQVLKGPCCQVSKQAISSQLLVSSLFSEGEFGGFSLRESDSHFPVLVSPLTMESQCLGRT